MDFETFIKTGLYLRNWSPKTAVIYRRAWKSYTRFQQGAGTTPEEGSLTKAQLEAWVISRREAGMSPSGINIYIRAMNSYSAWLHEEHGRPQVVVKQLKAPQKAVDVFSAADIRLLTAYRPKGFTETRTWALLQVLLDTGCRINELLTLSDGGIDFDNLLLSVDGKGGKFRRVPFSLEGRKTLWRFRELRRKRGIPGNVAFPTRDGVGLRYRNAYRDIIGLCARAGVTKRVHPHLSRHTFACHFMRNGGSIYTLSRILGHSSVSTTQIYVRGLGVEDFREEHSRFSPLYRA